MENLGVWADGALGLSLKAEQLDLGHMSARAAVMYIMLLAIVRLGKKRSLGRATAFDIILIIMVGSIAARALTGGAPFFPAIGGIAVLVALHWIMSYVGRDWRFFSGLIKGHSTLLIENGEILKGPLSDAHMSRDDLDEDLRQKGVMDISQVSEARLERSGNLSVIKR